MLVLDAIHKAYGAIVAVDNLSLTLRRGEVFGLLGPNGAGKTTTVSIAIGLLEPDAGTATLEGGGSPADPTVRQMIGLAPQALALYDDLTGQENLEFFGRLQGLRGRELKQRVAVALDFVGLTERCKGRVVTYSGGMQRRLNLAVAILHEPELILLDEPTVGVDPQSRNAIFENIAALQDCGQTIVYTTHYMEEAQRLCDRVGIIDNGKLLALDTVDGLIEAHGGPTTLIVEGPEGETRVECADPLAELLRRRDTGEPIGRFRTERPNLERVFLNLTGKALRD